jgi:hypothetical protein
MSTLQRQDVSRVERAFRSLTDSAFKLCEVQTGARVSAPNRCLRPIPSLMGLSTAAAARSTTILRLYAEPQTTRMPAAAWPAST